MSGGRKLTFFLDQRTLSPKPGYSSIFNQVNRQFIQELTSFRKVKVDVKIRWCTMFTTAVCRGVINFLIKLGWPKNKSLYDRTRRK